ncbi:NAD-dependent epimerase/dehydratase family protein [Staphylococcus sp. 11007852]|uniref:NAD-dependent epimerase/dehydratase family protein n=1 Tax=Staphylococcus TaxID=1279 RepID=UPI0014039E8E|nr:MULTISPECIES: NAD-dependent epimerase/dehydratase family protein [Staphylococcus]NHM73941.1 NAD-dependent epimerase/dehydratase family protein [Staphylococcus sp. 11007852]NJH83445.1 NAD-dependent epimerase/dehydratase family protein [Staphylococcus agnetis]NJH83807.1 NAD-dependent epimerase/dehydratase family protein [Staphylococcus agnetis]
MKTILITGQNGYVGNHLENNLKQCHRVSRVDVKTYEWKNEDWSHIDVVIHAAALVHNNQPHANMEDYMKVNYTLTKEVAEKAKNAGVKQFIFLSTANVYGLTGRVGEDVFITPETPIQPHTAYGISKMYAERALNEMATPQFNVAHIRPPMIYGYKAPGNFSKLEKVAKYLPIIPDIQNKRSAIYIDHLARFISVLIDKGTGGIYHPQDDFDLNTTRVIQTIRHHLGKPTVTIPFPHHCLKLLNYISLARKLYGNLKYDETLENHAITYEQDDFYSVMQATLNQ